MKNFRCESKTSYLLHESYVQCNNVGFRKRLSFREIIVFHLECSPYAGRTFG